MKNEKEKIVLTTQIIKEQDKNLLLRTIKEFVEEKFTTIDGVDYFVDGNNYRKLVTDTKEKTSINFSSAQYRTRRLLQDISTFEKELLLEQYG